MYNNVEFPIFYLNILIHLVQLKKLLSIKADCKICFFFFEFFII